MLQDMKTIYRIAKSELNSLFCSPIAWLVLVIFTFQMSMTFTDRIIWELKDFVINNREKDGMTAYFLLTGFGTPLFPGVLSYLYLYFPLLTMGLMSREFSSGSIKLLYSSPITSTADRVGEIFVDDALRVDHASDCYGLRGFLYVRAEGL